MATKSTLAYLAVASDDGGSRTITILIPSGKRGGSGTGRGDSGGATVKDAYTSPFGDISSENTFTQTALEIFAQGKIEGKTDAKNFCL